MVPDEWVIQTIEDIAKVTSGGTPSRSKSEYWGGNIPWVTTAEVKSNTIFDTVQKITSAGLENSSAKLFPPDTILMAMYGQGKTRGQISKLGIEASTNQACAAILLKEGSEPEFYYLFLQSQYKNIRNLSNSGGQKNLSAGLVKSIFVPVPPLPEQKKIADIISTWDKAIETVEKLIENSRAQKKALMQQLLTGKKRFAEFNVHSGYKKIRYGLIPNDWQYAKISDIANQYTKKNADNESYPVLSCSKHVGFVDSLEYFKKKVYSDNLIGYKLIPKGCFGFPSNHIEEGSIDCQNLYEFGLVSPIYTIFKPKNKLIDNKFLISLLKTEHYRQIFSASTNASVDRRGSLRWKEFCLIKIALPSLEEQQKIASVLTNADKEIELLEQQLSDLKQEKKALMQQLLTGKRRVTVDTISEALC